MPKPYPLGLQRLALDLVAQGNHAGQVAMDLGMELEILKSVSASLVRESILPRQ